VVTRRVIGCSNVSSALVATAQDVQRILATLLDVEERLTWDAATFRVRDKIFAMIHPSGQKATVKATKSEQAALLAADPATYAPARYTGRFGWVTVQLSSVCVEDLEDLIVEAWRQTAPKRSIATYDSKVSAENDIGTS
jgi:hypothetical protein